MNPWPGSGKELGCFAQGRRLDPQTVGGVNARGQALCLLERWNQDVDMKLVRLGQNVCRLSNVYKGSRGDYKMVKSPGEGGVLDGKFPGVEKAAEGISIAAANTGVRGLDTGLARSDGIRETVTRLAEEGRSILKRVKTGSREETKPSESS